MKAFFWKASVALLLLPIGSGKALAQLAPPVESRPIVGPPAPTAAPEPTPTAFLPAEPAQVPARDLRAVKLLQDEVDATIPVSIRDTRGAHITMRVPAALYRPANSFRLYGSRPFTLTDANRRSDMYRDAFLELATRPGIGPQVTAWDSLSSQVAWLAARGVSVDLPGVRVQVGPRNAGTIRLDGGVLAEVPGLAPVADTARRITSHPAYRHLSALTRVLGVDTVTVYADEPVSQTLRMRALATDAAEQRLLRMGLLLGLSGSSGDGAGLPDPAIRDGYLAARAEFEEVRRGLWPALGQSLQKSQGRLLLSAVKRMVLSPLGFWAIFGNLAWQGVEGALNVEYQGQYAIALATVAAEITRRAAPVDLALAAYAHYAVNYRLTETLKQPQILELKPAGGRSSLDWQMHCSGRCGELQNLLDAPTSAAPMPTPPASG